MVATDWVRSIRCRIDSETNWETDSILPPARHLSRVTAISSGTVTVTFRVLRPLAISEVYSGMAASSGVRGRTGRGKVSSMRAHRRIATVIAGFMSIALLAGCGTAADRGNGPTT